MRARRPERKQRGQAWRPGLFSYVRRAHGRGEKTENEKGTGSVTAEEQGHRATPSWGAGPTAPGNPGTAEGAWQRPRCAPSDDEISGGSVPSGCLSVTLLK